MSRKVFYYKSSRLGDQILDFFAANSGYFLHRARGNATKAIRVRRADDDEMDIGFVGVDLDTASLLTFTGSGDGFVTVWYDQMNSGNDVSQADPTKQPRIVISGVLQTINSKPAMKFDGTNDFLWAAGTVNNALNGYLYLSGVGEMKANNRAFVAKAILGSAANRYLMIRESTTYAYIDVGASLMTTLFNNSSVPQLFSMFVKNNTPVNNSTLFTYQQNILIDSKTTSQDLLQASAFRFLIGAYNNAADDGELYYNNGLIQCLGVWHGDRSADWNLINIEIDKYYNIL